MKNKVHYIGSFPPPYGGVTNKNKILFDELSKHIHLWRSHSQSSMGQAVSILAAILFSESFIIGVGSNTKLLKLSCFFSRVCPQKLSKSVAMVMGGTFAEKVKENKEYVNCLSCYKQLFVETSSMKKTLEEVGLRNVSVYPNCRRRPTQEYSVKKTKQPLKCVFFSKICPEKGVDTILEIAPELKGVTIDIWGHIDSEYEKVFLSSIENLSNVSYKGVFKIDGENVYRKLNEYDLLLLPTRWPAEGVPGILVEAKIAGLPAVVTDWAYNAEIIENNKSGIVLSENTSSKLLNVIRNLQKNEAIVDSLKHGAKESAKAYYYDTYEKLILDFINQ